MNFMYLDECKKKVVVEMKGQKVECTLEDFVAWATKTEAKRVEAQKTLLRYYAMIFIIALALIVVDYFVIY